MNKMKSLKARDVSDDLMERKTYLVKDANALIPLNLKVTVCYMHNNWRENRAWNKFEDKKVIIAKEPVPHNTPHHGTALTNLGGEGPDHRSPIYLCMGAVSKSTQKILVEIIELQPSSITQMNVKRAKRKYTKP